MSNQSRSLLVCVIALLVGVGPIAGAWKIRRDFRSGLARMVRSRLIARGDTSAALLTDDQIFADNISLALQPEEVMGPQVGDVLIVWHCDLLVWYWWAWLLFVAGASYASFVVFDSIHSTLFLNGWDSGIQSLKPMARRCLPDCIAENG